MKKRIISMIICIGMLLGLSPLYKGTSISAAGTDDVISLGNVDSTEYNYVIENGTDADTFKILENGTVKYDNLKSSDDISFSGTGTAITITVNVSYAIDVNITLNGLDTQLPADSGKAAFAIADTAKCTTNIRIADGTTNTLVSGENHAGIEKNNGNDYALNISGDTGTLNATGGQFGAGIGGGYKGSGENITITGGIVNPTGGVAGAGIGGGFGYATNNDEVIGGKGNNIKISGGTVNATGGTSGAGIGGGGFGSGENITITGGTVNATGGSTGAGIGGSGSSISSGTGTIIYCGTGENIEITDGTVTATSDWGAGIGGGNYNPGKNITISGGTVEATSTSGAGIGGGYKGSGENITINGGMVEATSTSGAGIGGGGSGSGENITINGGTVEATSTSGAGIGGGYKGSGENITISGGTVEATSRDGAGIGGGAYNPGKNITISGGTVKATSSTGSAIGGGGYSTGSDATITGGDITAIGNQKFRNGTYGVFGNITVSFSDTKQINSSWYKYQTSTSLVAPATDSSYTYSTVTPFDATDSTILGAHFIKMDNAAITPIISAFDKYTSTDISVTKSGDYILSTIKSEGNTLINGQDYTINGDTITISKDYLKKQTVGTTVLTFDYGMTANPTLTITVSDSSPKVTDGDGFKFTKKSNMNQKTTCSGDISKFVKLLVDDKELDKKFFELQSGSTIVTLKSSYLDTLSVGKHTMTFVYTDAEASSVFYVLAEETKYVVPDTANKH